MNDANKVLLCLLLGHRDDLNGQSREAVRVVRMNGTVDHELRLVERTYCSRCRRETNVEVFPCES